MHSVAGEYSYTRNRLSKGCVSSAMPGGCGHVYRGPSQPVSDPTTWVSTATPKLKGYYKEGFYVFGVVTTHDIEMLERESRTCRGPIACTTVVDSVALRLGYRLTSYAPGALCHRAPGPTLRPWAMNELYANSARRPIYRSHCAIRLERRTNSTCSSSNPTSF